MKTLLESSQKKKVTLKMFSKMTSFPYFLNKKSFVFSPNFTPRAGGKMGGTHKLNKNKKKPIYEREKIILW